MTMIRSILRTLMRRIAKDTKPSVSSGTPQGYWSGYHVDSPDSGFCSIQSSLAHYEWRNAQYPGYIELMPVDKADGLVVVDYGCGPGNDVIGFGHFSRPRTLHGVDVSPSSLQLARQRAALHRIAAEFIQVSDADPHIPLEDKSIDLIHSSGVLHHTPDPLAILREFKRVLRPDGYGQIMVYHYDSIWMHLYVAYKKMVIEGWGASLDKRAAFQRTTDGPDCPIALCYRPAEFAALAEAAGLRCKFAGASMSTHELKMLPSRFEAIESKGLDSESRNFLSKLTFDQQLWPRMNGVVAGINACFRVYPN